MFAYGDLVDERVRAAAFEHVRALNAMRNVLSAAEVRAGFVFEGQRIPLVSPARGIFKPQQMRFLLSILTAYRGPGETARYEDQHRALAQLYQSDQSVHYAFMGKDPEASDNQLLKAAWENRIPIIYFIGVAPKEYVAVLPAYIAEWDPRALQVSVGFGDPASFVEGRFADVEPARRYAMRAVKQRLHQVSFRQAVIEAYGGRCALSGLPEARLLDAAHIMPDSHEQYGQPIVPNGLPLTKLHHAAFDAHLLGVDPDCRIHVSKRLLAQRDGPVLEALKALNGATLRLPLREGDHPDRDRLVARFAAFRARA